MSAFKLTSKAVYPVASTIVFLCTVLLAGCSYLPFSKDESPENPCAGQSANPCNPCVGANPCNPCNAKMKNPCAPQVVKMKNPCAPQVVKMKKPGTGEAGQARIELIDKQKVLRPAGTTLYTGHRPSLISLGEQLWEDTNLSTNGLACKTCHNNGAAFLPGFTRKYPHKVAMASSMAGIDSIHVDEMIQLCLVKPMATNPMGWNSKDLGALSYYVLDVAQKNFRNKMANPCNPCGYKMLNDGVANPCAETEKKSSGWGR